MALVTLRGATIAVLAVAALTACSPPAPTGPTRSPRPSSSETPGPSVSPTPGVPSTSPPATASPSPSPSNCTQRWGTGAIAKSSGTSAPITGVRAGRHHCYDRLVVDIDGVAGGYDVRYVPAVVEQGRGEPVSLRGGAYLQVLVLAPAYDPETGAPTYRFSDRTELADVTGFVSFRQVAWGGSFEGQTLLGLGVVSERPFRVFTLQGPGDGSRVVVDVAH